MHRVSFVIPACDEADTISDLVTLIIDLYEPHEVLVVDDGSADLTAARAEASGAKVVTHLYRMGNGAAIKTGCRAATGDTLVFMDADGQHPVDAVEKLLEHKRMGFDLVVGSRSGRENHSSFFRWIANQMYNFVASKITGFPITDLTSGMRVVDRKKFISILHLLPNGFSYPTTSTMAFIRSAYQVKFVDVPIQPDRTGSSHISIFKDGARFFLIIFKIGMLYSPFKFMAPLAIAQVLLLLTAYLPSFLQGAPQFTNGMALLAVGSVLTIGIATVAEQITTLLYKV